MIITLRRANPKDVFDAYPELKGEPMFEDEDIERDVIRELGIERAEAGEEVFLPWWPNL